MIFTIMTIILLVVLFSITIAKMIKNNFSEYTFVLILEFIGISINFGSIVTNTTIPIALTVIIYLVSVIIPIGVLYFERKNIHPSEFILYIPGNAGISKEKLYSILKKHPESYLAHKCLAEYYLKNKEISKAQNEYCKLIELMPKEYENYCILAKLYQKSGKNDKAIKVLQQALKEKPKYTEASILLGKLLFDEEKFKEAILVYREALRYEPGVYELYYLLGMTYTRLNDFNNAKENYKKAAKLNSYKDVSNLSIGQIYLIFEEYDKAEEYFYKTLQSDDDFVLSNAYYNLAKIKLIQKQESQAIQFANLALECNPKLLKKMENDDLFVIILSKLNIKGKSIINTKMDKSEIKTVEHLGKTFNIVETLTNNYIFNGNNKERDID